MKPNKPLPKIGPGLGSRSRIWSRVLQKVSSSNHISLPLEERHLLERLSRGDTWIDFVPPEWVDIHAAQYEDSRSQPMDEREITKIDKDVPRTFGLFVRNSRLMRMTFPSNMDPYYDALKEVLILVARDRGYCQGINFLAASFLIHTGDRKESGILMSFLLKHRRLEILYDPRYSSLLDYMKIFEKRLRKYCPRLYRHFKRSEYTTVSYAIEWFTTCFIVTCPGELSLCVFDLLLAGFDDIMIRIGLGLLVVLEEKLLKLDFEGLHQQFKQLVMLVDPYLVMVHALQFQFHRKLSILDGMSLMIDALEPGSNGNLHFSSGKGSAQLPLQANETTYVDEEESEQDDSPPNSPQDSCAADGEDRISDVVASSARRQRKQLKSVHKLSHQLKQRLRVWRQAVAPKGRTRKTSSPSSPSPTSSCSTHQIPTRVASSSSHSTSRYNQAGIATLSLDNPSQLPSPPASTIQRPSSSSVLQATPVVPIGGVESTALKPSYVYHNPKSVNVLTSWWNDTWRSAMRHGAIQSDDSGTGSKKPVQSSVQSNNGSPWPSSSGSKSKAGQQLGVRSEVYDTAVIVSNNFPGLTSSSAPRLTPSLKPPSVCTTDDPIACLRSPLNYDGDTEVPVIARVDSPHTGNQPTVSPSSSSMSNNGALIPTEDVESTYLDQGGELVEEIDASLQLPNFRIAQALENLEENWFHSLRRKVAEGNLKVRAKHQKLTVRGVETVLNQGFASAAAAAAASACSSPTTRADGGVGSHAERDPRDSSRRKNHIHSNINDYNDYSSDSLHLPAEDMVPHDCTLPCLDRDDTEVGK